MNRLILPHEFRKGGARRQYPTRGCRLNFSKGAEHQGHGRVVPAIAHPPYPPNCAVNRGRYVLRVVLIFLFSQERDPHPHARHVPRSKVRDSRHARSSSAEAACSARGPCRASIFAASDSISARGMRRGRMMPCRNAHSSAPQIGLVAAPRTIHSNACLTVSIRAGTKYLFLR